MGKMNVQTDTLLNLFAEMVLDESIRQFKERHLYTQIDKALAAGDKQTFIALTTELLALRSRG
jgi:uncharacterized protein YpiB (UPF0302 family)